jgi:hypothetical protein
MKDKFTKIDTPQWMLGNQPDSLEKLQCHSELTLSSKTDQSA